MTGNERWQLIDLDGQHHAAGFPGREIGAFSLLRPYDLWL